MNLMPLKNKKDFKFEDYKNIALVGLVAVCTFLLGMIFTGDKDESSATDENFQAQLQQIQWQNQVAQNYPNYQYPQTYPNYNSNYGDSPTTTNLNSPFNNLDQQTLNSLRNTGNNDFSQIGTQVSEVSTTKSFLTPDFSVLNEGENFEITVNLLDGLGNPVANQQVQLVSSNPNDNLSSIQVSDQNGQATFEVQPGNSSTSTTSYAAKTSEFTVIENKAQIAFLDDLSEEQDLIAELNSDEFVSDFSNVGNSSGPVDGLKIENIPTSIQPASNITLTVGAYDPNDQLVTNYVGTVRFSVSGENADFVSIPQDYTFKQTDQGKHTFSLAFSFQQPGNYDLKVTDIDNQAVFGEAEIIVGETGELEDENNGSNSGNQNSGSNNSNSSALIEITNPLPGTYSNNTLVIAGKTTPGARLKIYDNEVELSSLSADIAGNFAFTTNALVDGAHRIYVTSVNDVGTIISTSETIDVTIDTEAPGFERIELTPKDNINPGNTVELKLYVEEDLAEVVLIIEENLYDMARNEDHYEVTFVAPMEFGEYDLGFLLVDDLGNESRVTEEKAFRVGPAFDDKSKPDDVSGLTATAGNKRVTLKWNAASSTNGEVVHYRVFYGESPTELSQAVDTFTNSTTWYIPNLENEKDYYFAVVAVDDNGQQSELFSNIVTATPSVNAGNGDENNNGENCEENDQNCENASGSGSDDEKVERDPEVENGVAGEENLQDSDDLSETGPGIFWLIVLSIFMGFGYVKFREA